MCDLETLGLQARDLRSVCDLEALDLAALGLRSLRGLRVQPLALGRLALALLDFVALSELFELGALPCRCHFLRHSPGRFRFSRLTPALELLTYTRGGRLCLLRLSLLLRQCLRFSLQAGDLRLTCQRRFGLGPLTSLPLAAIGRLELRHETVFVDAMQRGLSLDLEARFFCARQRFETQGFLGGCALILFRLALRDRFRSDPGALSSILIDGARVS
jgi:hypothetical protein